MEENVYYRAAILTDRNTLAHKSIAPVTGPKTKINNLLPSIQNYLEENQEKYKELFPDISTRIKHTGKYTFQLLSEEKKESFDTVTLNFLNFLKDIGALTPGSNGSLPPWVLNLPDEKEREIRKKLHYTYGTANAPPLQSHHVTINYDNHTPDGIHPCPPCRIECAGIVIYTTNLAGELLDKVWGIYF